MEGATEHELLYRVVMISIDAVGEPQTMPAALTPEGHYIGSPSDAEYLCIKRGIKPELRAETSNTCAIGFCGREQKWYGWSHRAIFGWGVGDVACEGPECVIEGTFEPGHVIANLDEARRAACEFAAAVS